MGAGGCRVHVWELVLGSFKPFLWHCCQWAGEEREPWLPSTGFSNLGTSGLGYSQ